MYRFSLVCQARHLMLLHSSQVLKVQAASQFNLMLILVDKQLLGLWHLQECQACQAWLISLACLPLAWHLPSQVSSCLHTLTHTLTLLNNLLEMLALNKLMLSSLELEVPLLK